MSRGDLNRLVSLPRYVQSRFLEGGGPAWIFVGDTVGKLMSVSF